MGKFDVLKNEDLFFWEQMERIAEAIRSMHVNEKRDYLWNVIEREIDESATPMREMIKLMLVRPLQAKTIIENIRRDKLEEIKDISSDINEELKKICVLLSYE